VNPSIFSPREARKTITRIPTQLFPRQAREKLTSPPKILASPAKLNKQPPNCLNLLVSLFRVSCLESALLFGSNYRKRRAKTSLLKESQPH
jgi:hypothetical protein